MDSGNSTNCTWLCVEGMQCYYCTSLGSVWSKLLITSYKTGGGLFSSVRTTFLSLGGRENMFWIHIYIYEEYMISGNSIQCTWLCVEGVQCHYSQVCPLCCPTGTYIVSVLSV